MWRELHMAAILWLEDIEERTQNQNKTRGREKKKRGTKHQQNGISKNLPISNYFKYMGVKFPNWKTQSGWMDFLKKIQLYLICKRFTLALRTQKAETKYMKRDILCKCSQKKAGWLCLYVFIPDKIVFKLKTVTRDSHHIMTKESLHQENTTLTNICAPNTRAPKYVKNINSTEERDHSTIIARSFNTPLYINGYYHSSLSFLILFIWVFSLLFLV